MKHWFEESRFGFFIHWGIYSQTAQGEWARYRSEELGGNPATFNPINFNPQSWAELAWNAGMRYVVFTTKHHDGFCMFDSHYTDFKITNTPYQKDVTKELVEAFRDKGLKIGFYHSLIDWHHPHYLPDHDHPQGKNGETQFPAVNSNIYRKYLFDSVHQLMTEYGKIDLLFWDYCTRWKTPQYFDPDKLLQMIRTEQPDIIINDRMTYDRITDYKYICDYRTPEVAIPTIPPSSKWETCATTNGAWGYNEHAPLKTQPEAFQAGLVACVANNGNLLLNVGPDSLGQIPDHSTKVLRSLAQWMTWASEAIHGCGRASFTPPPLGIYTQKGKHLYLYLPVHPMAHFILPDLRDKAVAATLLRTGENVTLSSWGLEHACPNDVRLIPPPSIQAHDIVKITLAD